MATSADRGVLLVGARARGAARARPRGMLALMCDRCSRHTWVRLVDWLCDACREGAAVPEVPDTPQPDDDRERALSSRCVPVPPERTAGVGSAAGRQ